MPIPSLIPVESSQIAAIGYDDAKRLLFIEFKAFKAKPGQPQKPNTTYEYQNVSPELFAALMAAESKGKFFGAEIKPHKDKFPFRKLSAEELAQ